MVLPYLGGADVDARRPAPAARSAARCAGVVPLRGARAVRPPWQGAASSPRLDALPAVRGHLVGRAAGAEGAAPAALAPSARGGAAAALALPRAALALGGRCSSTRLDFEGEAEERRAARARGGPRRSPTSRACPRRCGRPSATRVLEAGLARAGHPRAAPAEVRPHLGGVAERRPRRRTRFGSLPSDWPSARCGPAALPAGGRRVQAASPAAAQAARDRERGRTGRASRRWTRRALGCAARGGSANGSLEVRLQLHGRALHRRGGWATLQVVDAGICLGHPPGDDLVTLESLPVGHQGGDRDRPPRHPPACVRIAMQREVCFLIGARRTVLWSDASDEPRGAAGLARALGGHLAAPRAARGDLPTATRSARWPSRRGRDHHGGAGEALGRTLRFSVVAPDGMVLRLPDGTVQPHEGEPWWAALLRLPRAWRRATCAGQA